METLQSETKTRVLPSWLTAQVATKNVAPMKAPKRMRMAAVPVAAARCDTSGQKTPANLASGAGASMTWARSSSLGRTARLPVTRTVYCMNEAEIVDVALGILIEKGTKWGKKRTWNRLRERAAPFKGPRCMPKMRMKIDQRLLWQRPGHAGRWRAGACYIYYNTADTV
nr:cell cycle regulator of non-homologous end joining isoform X2 [Gorilla gorilla gorilla]